MTNHGTTHDEPIDDAALHAVAVMFGMLAATARLQIVVLLSSGERDVGTLAEEVGQSVAAVSQHLAKLKLAGIVRSRKEGRRQVYLVNDSDVSDVVALALRRRQRQSHPIDTRTGHSA
ncbi:ArsR/SmtB family transcription factor [Mycobacterium sp. PDNC021]|uniref:ArsR/SmtB family transcription factor n=1 Tax=Mycobacterium sp. PDNC021 TaxID=3391399 RepID=UPI003AADD933